MKSITTLACVALLTLASATVLAAETVHLTLTINGQPIKGESTQASMGRQDTIECVYYDQKVSSARDAATGMATGKRQYEPILIRKRIDKSSPLLLKALAENQVVEGVFRFFRPNPTGDGTTQQFYTVSISKARIASVRQIVPDTLTPATSQMPPVEEVTFVFPTIAFSYAGNVNYQDAWGPVR